jgi:hypothetical protein
MVKYTLSTSGKDIELSRKDLLEVLLQTADTNIPNNESLVELEDFLSIIYSTFPKGFFLENPASHMFKIYFLVGFYYSSFINKNDVRITTTKE